MNGGRLNGWVPFRLHWNGGVPEVEWCYLGTEPFADPFFETTIHFEVQTPFNSLFRFRTPIEALGEYCGARSGLRPTGFIFHLSRCGSTLITQLLASRPENVVLSEPGVLSAAMRSRPGVSAEQRLRWVQWLVNALGQPRAGVERHLFIKFDPASILDFPLLRQAFPGVPWILVYRDPVEIMVSHARSAAPFVTKGMLGPYCLTLDPAEAASMDDEEYAARVLGILAQAAVEHARGSGAMLVHYSQLPEIVWSGLRDHFGIAFSAEEVDRLKQVASFDAKRPQQLFRADTEEKKKEASEKTRLLAGQWIVPHYRALEEIRRPRGFAAFQRWILDNPQLLERLRGLGGREEFIAMALKMAAESGFPLLRSQVESAIAEVGLERAGRIV